MSIPNDESLPLEHARRIDAACDQFESRWQSGSRPELEAFVAESSGDERQELIRELIGLDLFYRRKLGEVPTAGELPDPRETARITVFPPEKRVWVAADAGRIGLLGEVIEPWI